MPGTRRWVQSGRLPGRAVAVGVAIVAVVVVGSVAATVWAAARRAWNADGADDRRRKRLEPAGPDAEER